MMSDIGLADVKWSIAMASTGDSECTLERVAEPPRCAYLLVDRSEAGERDLSLQCRKVSRPHYSSLL